MRASIPIQSLDEAHALLGIQDRNARLFRSHYDVTVTVRQGAIHLEGDDVDVTAARRIAEELLGVFRQRGELEQSEAERVIKRARPHESPRVAPAGVIVKNRLNRSVAPRSVNQKAYARAMEDAEVVFGIGPAGTGKTYLAVAMAVRMLREGAVTKLILTRPAVEAGEKLGFLPGTFEAKINPYLRPLYDALYDLVEPAQIRKFAESDIIEIAPLAYMRGRTLSDAFIILDEAQNTTAAQMKMFLTRMGEGSRMVVTGDVTQIDLPERAVSGLVHASGILSDVEGIRICHFGPEDIIRHPVVQQIVNAYEQEQKE